MFKVIGVKEQLGGSIEHQADIEKTVLQNLENYLNDLDMVKVHSVAVAKDNAEFGLVAIVEVEAKAKNTKVKK